VKRGRDAPNSRAVTLSRPSGIVLYFRRSWTNQQSWKIRPPSLRGRPKLSLIILLRIPSVEGLSLFVIFSCNIECPDLRVADLFLLNMNIRTPFCFAVPTFPILRNEMSSTFLVSLPRAQGKSHHGHPRPFICIS
jgi:hypothetical protein